MTWSYEQSEYNNDCDELLVLSRKNDTTGDAYGLLIDGDNILKGAGTGGPRSWVVGIFADKTEGVIQTAGADDALLRVGGANYVACEEIWNFRGINVNVKNRDGGTCGELNNIISVGTKQGSTTAKAIGLSVDTQHLSADTPDEIGGIDVALNTEGGEATLEYGIQVRTRGTINVEVDTVFNIAKDATDHGFTNLFQIEADAVNYAACTGDVTVDANDKVIPITLGGSTYYLIAVDSIPAG